MSWTKLIKKMLQAFIVGGAASATAVQPSTPEETTQVALIGLVISFVAGLSNWWKHKDD